MKTTASLAIAATLAAPSLAKAQDKRLVITAFAGVRGDNVKKHVLDPLGEHKDLWGVGMLR